ncbi:MAG: class I SAM-dependent methyltransferase [Nitrospirota bacterium]
MTFPIEHSIPRFVQGDSYVESFGFQWRKHARTQIDKFNGSTFSRDRFFATTQWSTDLKGERVLEAGSGAGRFTQIVCETGATVFSAEMSAAVDANFENNHEFENLTLLQADIYRLPFAESMFDKVYCLGVLQHTPDVKRAFMSLARVVRPGGELVIDVYRKSLTALCQWKYVLRPFTKRQDKVELYGRVERFVSLLLPLAIGLRSILGPIGGRLVPICNYSHLGLSDEMNREWSVLDTFDMYSPAYDSPQSLSTVEQWFAEAGFTNICVRRGMNGIVGRGIKGYEQPIVSENLKGDNYARA